MLNKYFDRLRDEYLRDPTPTNMGIAIQACASAVDVEVHEAIQRGIGTMVVHETECTPCRNATSGLNPRTLEAMRQELVLIAFDRAMDGRPGNDLRATMTSRARWAAFECMTYVNEMLAAMAGDQVPAETEQGATS